MASDSCGICGGDGRIANSFGNQTRCPSCHGTGRRPDEGGLRDVTKTKPSHHKPSASAAAAAAKPVWPTTFEGGQLAKEVNDTSGLSVDTKARLTREIIAYEASHTQCTQTFIKKMRKLIRPVPA